VRFVCAASISTVLFVSSTSFAQGAGDEIRGHVKDGQKVSVTDEQGREFKGRAALGPDLLTIASGSVKNDVPYQQIVRIDRKDGLKNGALIGLAVGAALGVGLVQDGSDCDPVVIGCGDPGAGNYVAAGLVLAGLGSAIGVGIDALIGGDRTVYRRGDTRVRVVPSVSRGGATAALTISW